MGTLDPADLHDLYESSEAYDVGLGLAAFSEALTAVGERHLPSNATYGQRISFFRKLHLQDLALAQSCALGNAAAWERFLERFSSRLYAAAMAISKNEQIATDLSGSLAGDLFASGKPCGKGLSSKMLSYSGRGSLEGWLKALLANAYVDRYRSQCRVVSLDRHIDILKNLCAGEDARQRKADPRLDIAIQAAFLERPSGERFILAAYFFDGWTLAKIAKTAGIHESSVSRRLDRILRKLRRAIHQRLQKAGMSPGQIEESFKKEGWEQLSIDIRGLLLRGLARE
jgi:RNA polymerase sigma-70 factor (ECF subfamily)